MRCPKTGFTPLKIASLVVGAIAIVVHITAVAYPEWDGIDAQWRPAPRAPILLPIKAHASLWDLTVMDRSRKLFSPVREKRDTTWKEPIILMATTGIAAGVVGEGLIVLTALLQRCTKNFIVHLCAKMLSVTSILCASFECLMGAILYKYNYTKQQSAKDLNRDWQIPYDKHKLRAGFYIECTAGGLFILTSLITVLDIMYYEKNKMPSISPAIDEEKQSSGKDKTISEKIKKGDKLVLEDVTEDKSEKKK